MYASQDEATLLGHATVDTEHLLLGLVWDSESMACRILAALGVTGEQVREEARREAVMGPGGEGPCFLSIPAHRATDRAFTESRRLNSPRVGTEHLLLGLLSEEGGLAARCLNRLGVTRERVRAAVDAMEDGD
jgi:ATP-dependent Clp protease ATP-binding subunit ClpC